MLFGASVSSSAAILALHVDIFVLLTVLILPLRRQSATRGGPVEYNYLKKIATGAILWLLASTSFAQSYPSKPVKVVVPYPPGTAVDVVTRMVTQSMAASFGQAFVVENRSGAGSTIDTAAVASAPADGYTVLVQSSALTSTPALMQSLPYDTARDFAGVTTLADLQLVLVVAKSTGIKSVQELIAAARARPGALAGIGTSTHIGTEKFRTVSRTRDTHRLVDCDARIRSDAVGRISVDALHGLRCAGCIDGRSA